MAKSEPFLFVSHVAEDRALAMQIVGELEARGVPCWIAPRNVRPGQPFDNEIVDAIESSRAVLLIFSDRCNDSEYIRREVTVAGESHKVIIPFRIEDVPPRRGLRVRLSDLHWIDGFAARERAVDELAEHLTSKRTAATRQTPEEDTTAERKSPPRSIREPQPSTAGAARSSKPMIIALAVVAIVIISGLILAFNKAFRETTVETAAITPIGAGPPPATPQPTARPTPIGPEPSSQPRVNAVPPAPAPTPAAPSSTVRPPVVAAPPDRGPADSAGHTLWMHNGSIVYLVANGSIREFYYHQPRPGMLTAGAKPGSLLFWGRYNDGNYIGTAYIFNAKCGKFDYHVSGPVLDDYRRVVMQGEAPRLGNDCQETNRTPDTLEFSLMK
jgi:hypothetical protein